MASRSKQQAEPRPAPRLYLVTPPVADADTFAADLAAALDGADVAAVLVRLADGDERALTNRIKILAPVVQNEGAALLIDGHARLAARAGADGAHLTGITAFTEALETLKPDRIAGVAGLATRHDAMLATEAGADYVMFGEPTEQGRPPFPAVLDRIAWWAEVFESPCVGYAGDAEEAAALAATGADFVAVDFIWSDPRGPRAATAAAAAALTLPEPVP
ncbi:MAG: thiamine phosphate synthase [Pseudolabrys sp.]